MRSGTGWRGPSRRSFRTGWIASFCWPRAAISTWGPNGRPAQGLLDLGLERQARLRALQCAFFARGNDPSVWLNGWYPKLAAAEIHAGSTVDCDFFKAAGGRPILLIQAGEDNIAPPALAGRVLAQELGAQVTYAEIPFAGHAMSSEQPDLIADIVLLFLGRP